MKVAVITSSLGRDLLARCIESVQAQTYPVKHHVFINHAMYFDQAKPILEKYPNVFAYYLHEGGFLGDLRGPEAVYAGASFIVGDAEIVLFLNDDDQYEPNHVESLVRLIEDNNLDWAFSLRKIVNDNNEFVAEDDCESLGYWPCVYNDKTYLVDCSCYALRTKIARAAANGWCHKVIGDRAFLLTLKALRTKAGCTGLSTVKYRLHSGSGVNAKFFEINNPIMESKYPNGLPWRKPIILGEI